MHPNSITIRYIIYGQYVLLILQQRNNNTILHRIVSIKNILNNIISCIKAFMLLCFSLNTQFSLLCFLLFILLSTLDQLVIPFSLRQIWFFSLFKAHDIFTTLVLTLFYSISISLHGPALVSMVQKWWIFHLLQKNIYF